MQFSRRGFTKGALAFTVGSQFSLPAFAQLRPDLASAIDRIRAYAETHRRYFGLPGMTIGLSTPDGLSSVANVGFANVDSRTAITDETLFQIGSISKVMTATLLHQFANEGRFKLTDRFSDLLPEIPLPAGNTIRVQHLLDHVAGLPGDAPTFPLGGLWTAYAPGAHWHYSNTAYDMLGKLAEHFGGKPLDQLLQERVFTPLGMTHSHGSITGDDRLLYAQGYEAADGTVPFARGTPLAPAAWVDVTFGAGSVSSTAQDMTRFLRTMANAVEGRGGLGLPAPLARAFTNHAVPSDTPGMTYGNGLMHVTNGERSYLHHTGGMVAFSSSFHVDKASGVAAFASSNISGFAEYRPRLVTRYAVDVLTNALAGKPLPAPPPMDTALSHPAQYAGGYAGPSGAFDVRLGTPLKIVTRSGEAELQSIGGDLFRTTHPEFRDFTLKFERKAGAIAGASWGPSSYLRQGTTGSVAPSDPVLAKLAGRYVNDNPWVGSAHVVERGGKLWIGTEVPLTRMADNLWRIGGEPWSPERGSFVDFIDGRPQAFLFSGEKFLRHDV
jgi:CubicO group peptidase (beta-lactamase class C family)